MNLHVPFYGKVKVNLKKVIIGYLYIFSLFDRANTPALSRREEPSEFRDYKLGEEQKCDIPGYETSTIRPFSICKQFDLLEIRGNDEEIVSGIKCISETNTVPAKFDLGVATLKELEQPMKSCIDCNNSTRYINRATFRTPKPGAWDGNKIVLTSDESTTTITGLSRSEILSVEFHVGSCMYLRKQSIYNPAIITQNKKDIVVGVKSRVTISKHCVTC